MQVRCPNCRQFMEWEGNPYRPFCSESCKKRDLGNWASGQYRVPMHDVTEEGTPPDESGERETGEE